jgi:hypothetical protein
MINDPNYVPYTKSVGEPTRGNDPYGSSDFIKNTPLGAKPTVQMGRPSIGTDYAFGGITKTASTTGPTGEVETTYNHANLSKKFKYPQVSQDTVPQDIPLDTI